ncbi:MAG: hypothetical protein LBQ90_00065, partial [Synergistaceae bacterium]|nr:hypothetical protein [Synergistaceae bacterium]
RDEKNQGRGQENNPLPFPGEAVNRLHPKYRAVLRALPERGTWSADEWSALARRHGFMPNALLEELNTWGEETLGDFLLLDEDGDLVLNAYPAGDM